MDETLLLKTKVKTVAGYKAAVAELLTEMDRLNAQMDRDDVEIERLKRETQVISERTSEKLALLQEQVHNLSRTA